MTSLYDAKSLITDNFIGCGLDECDVLRITGSNLIYEYEIKASRSDFKAELKKKINKHEVLRGKHKTNPYVWNNGSINTEEVLQERWGSVGRASFFYYVCPNGLIKPDEIPDFSGLIYVFEDGYQIIKKVPKLHSFKATEKLIRKVCNALTAKNIFGSSYMTYRNKESQRLIENNT